MWKTLDRNIVFENNWISVIENSVVTPTGLELVYTTIKSSDVVAIIPIIGEKIVMVKNFRYATGKSMLEFPAGHLDKGETIRQCALRELKEETGYISSHIKHIYSFYVSICTCF